MHRLNIETTRNRFDINTRRVFGDIGYAADCKPSARMVSLVDDYVEHAGELIDPLYSYAIKDILLVRGPYVIIEGSIVFESEVIARLLEQCEKVAVLTLTIGRHLEETAYQLAKDGHILQAAVLEAIGSDAAERLADFVQNKISDVANSMGLCDSRRFSPGYCDWDVSQQRMVFQAMNGNRAGIRLTEGCLMLPRKSISGIIGLGPPSVKDYNPCQTCDKQDCVGRR